MAKVIFRTGRLATPDAGALHVQLRADFGHRESGDADRFLAGLFAVGERDRAAGQAELVGEEFAERVVGAAVERGGVNLDFQRVAQPADDFAARRVGNGLDDERAEFFHGNQPSASASAAMISSAGSVPTQRRSRSGSMPLAASSARPAGVVTRS